MTRGLKMIIFGDYCFDYIYEGSGFIVLMQETFSSCIGFDYTILSSDTGKEIDGGIIEDDRLNKEEALQTIVEDLGVQASDFVLVAFSERDVL